MEKENSCKEICLRHMNLLQRKPTAMPPFPQKVFLPRIHEQQMLHSTINEAITKPLLSSRVFVDEKLNFEDQEI